MLETQKLQTNDIEDLIQQQVDYLIVNPTDSSAISSAVESANNEGIPVITLDRSVDKETLRHLSHPITLKAVKWLVSI